MEPLIPGDPAAIGPYRLLGRLGHGGMGRVYLGRDRDGYPAAVKAIHPHVAGEPRFRARFAREVAAARAVTGPWTAAVLDADPDAELPWVATAYVAGPDLQHAVERHGPLPEAAARALGAGLAEALAAVHERRLVHRDLKPSNVLLALDGPRLIDFGIARATDASTVLTTAGVAVGSPGYMAPEQLTGAFEVGPAADVFSLGAVVAYAAGGRPAFQGDTPAQLLYRVAHEEPDLGGLPEALRETVAACLAKDPARRPAPAELARAWAGPGGAAAALHPGWLPGPVAADIDRREDVLGWFSGGEETTEPAAVVPPAPDRPPPRRPRRRVSRRVAGLLAVAALLLAAGSAFLLTDPGGGEDGGEGKGNGGGGAAEALPRRYAGTWHGRWLGETTGALPLGPLTVTLRPGAVGEEVGTARIATELDVVVCVKRLTLTRVAPDRLTFHAETDRARSDSPGELCPAGPSTAVVRWQGEHGLHYTDEDPDQHVTGDVSRRE